MPTLQGYLKHAKGRRQSGFIFIFVFYCHGGLSVPLVLNVVRDPRFRHARACVGWASPTKSAARLQMVGNAHPTRLLRVQVCNLNPKFRAKKNGAFACNYEINGSGCKGFFHPAPYKHAFTRTSISINSSIMDFTSLSAMEFGPSQRALSGSGWTSMNRPSTPTATAALAR